MMFVIRIIFAVLSTIGLAASVLAYLGSFFGLTTGPVSNAHPWLFVFFAGVFVTAIPASLMEYTGPISDSKLFVKCFGETRPRWTFPAIRAAFAFALVNFIIFLVLTRGARFDIANGQYVLDDHPMSQTQYLSLAAWETRFFASFMIGIYLYMTMYWWFPRIKTQPGPYDS